MNNNKLTYNQVTDLVLELKAEYERWLRIWEKMGVSDTFTEVVIQEVRKEGE